MRLLLLAPWVVLLASRVPLVGEVVGIFLPATALLAIAFGLRAATSRRQPMAAALAASLALAGVTGTLLPRAPIPLPPPEGGVSLISANMTASNDGWLASGVLAALAPDVVVTLETPRVTLLELGTTYANRVGDSPRGLGGVNVFSDRPLTVLPPLPGTEGARSVIVQVGGANPFTLVAAHLPRPWLWGGGLEGASRRGYQATPLTQLRLVRAFADGIADLPRPVVVAGDLNLSDRGHGYRLLTRQLDDVMRTRWAAVTSTRAAYLPLLLRIDHVLVDGWCGQARGLVPLPGSDHSGVAADLGPCPAGSGG